MPRGLELGVDWVDVLVAAAVEGRIFVELIDKNLDIGHLFGQEKIPKWHGTRTPCAVDLVA